MNKKFIVLIIAVIVIGGGLYWRSQIGRTPAGLGNEQVATSTTDNNTGGAPTSTGGNTGGATTSTGGTTTSTGGNNQGGNNQGGNTGAALLGTVTSVTSLGACPSGFPSNAPCSQATVSCPNTTSINVTYSVAKPAGAQKGTIVLLSGSGGTKPYAVAFDQPYLQAGYTVITTAWATAWEDSGIAPKNIRTAACRPATLLNYIYKNVSTAGARCAQGSSGGSAQIAYALTAYGASSYLDKASLISGPVFSDIELGCKVPKAQPVTVCAPGQYGCVGNDTFSAVPQYGGSGQLSQFTGEASCVGSTPTTASQNAAWKAMSIVDGTPASSYSYPKTSLAGFLCDNGVNNSASQGNLYYQNFTNSSQLYSYSLTPVKNCQGAEGVEAGITPGGQGGMAAIITDMLDPLRGCVAHH